MRLRSLFSWLAICGYALRFTLGFACGLGVAWAQPAALNASLNETVELVPKTRLFTIALETTVYKPDGPGPFPIAVINHGKSEGNPHFQTRYRPEIAVRYFLERGYAVVVPMRQGFSKSGGNYVSGGCNVQSNGEVQAQDVQAVLDDVLARPWANKNQIVVLGQSHGGWTTLALGAQNYPGVKALVNFAGGLRLQDCLAWERNLAKGAASYGAQTKTPSLWFYGDNDSYFTPATWSAMFEQYTAAGGPARLVAFGPFGSDAHAMFGAWAGAKIWQPEVTKLLASVGLPSQPQTQYAKYAAPAPLPTPPPTGFAKVEDETQVPFIQEPGRAAYKKYLSQPTPRAFAVSPNGTWGWASEGYDPLRRALDFCQGHAPAPGACKLYAVNDAVVWEGK